MREWLCMKQWGVWCKVSVVILEVVGIEKVQQGKIMGQYNITKVIDGLFVSDQAVPQDAAFLMSNKVIRMVGWVAAPSSQTWLPEEVQSVMLSKSVEEVRFPSFQELQIGFRCLQQAAEEMLCGLIYSESELQAALIGIMYLMRKFAWDCNTAYSFLRGRMEMFQFSEQAIDGLENYEQELRQRLRLDLGHILWEFQFLKDYQPVSDEERLIVSTVKNKLRGKEVGSVQQRGKKTRRIRWSDQQRPSSAFSISSAKNIPKGSLLKGRLPSPMTLGNCLFGQDIGNVRESEVMSQSLKSSAKIRGSGRELGGEWQQNAQYLQLKQMSRTNFNDYRQFSRQVRRRGTVKPVKRQKQKSNTGKSASSAGLQSINALIGIYSGHDKGRSLVRSGSAQSFLSGLRGCSKG